MITVTVRLSGLLRKAYKSAPSARMEEAQLPNGANVAALLNHYGIAHPSAHIIVVNRQWSSLETLLQDGDEVRILPHAAGG